MSPHRAARPPASEDATPLADALSLTIRHACQTTDISKTRMHELIGAGEVKSFLMGRRRYIVVESLRDYIARRAAEPLVLQRRGRYARGGRKVGPTAPKSAKPVGRAELRRRLAPEPTA